MQTIETRYTGPTDRRGTRFIARAEGGRITVSYDYELTADGNHKAAAEALARKLNWTGRMVGGHTRTGMVWVFVDAWSPEIVLS